MNYISINLQWGTRNEIKITSLTIVSKGIKYIGISWLKKPHKSDDTFTCKYHSEAQFHDQVILGKVILRIPFLTHDNTS